METKHNTGGHRKGSTILSLVMAFAAAVFMAAPVDAQDTSRQEGWIMFNDSIAEELELRDTQLERLHTIDRRYQADYQRLGDDPRSDPNYLALTERRNAEIQTVLDSDQYQKWLRMNDYDYNSSQWRSSPGPQSTEMDRRDPQGNNFQRDAEEPDMGRQTPKTGPERGNAGGVGNTP